MSMREVVDRERTFIQESKAGLVAAIGTWTDEVIAAFEEEVRGVLPDARVGKSEPDFINITATVDGRQFSRSVFLGYAYDVAVYDVGTAIARFSEPPSGN